MPTLTVAAASNQPINLSPASYTLNIASYIVTTTADEDNGSPDPSMGTGTSLREAIKAANGNQGLDFIAFNRTGKTVASLSIRPDEGPLAPGAAENPWSDNVLVQSDLPDGQRVAAHYEADIELCRWQLRVTFADRKTRDYPGVNLCETIRVDLR